MRGVVGRRGGAALGGWERAGVAGRGALGAARLGGSAGVIRGAVEAGVPVTVVAEVFDGSRQAVYAVLREGDGS